MRARERLARLLGSQWTDLVLAVGLSLGMVLYVAAQGLLAGRNGIFETGCGVAVIACIAPRRRYPRLAALTAASFAALASLGNTNPLPSSPPMVAIFLLAYSLGAADGTLWSVAALACLGAGTQAADGIAVFNPFIVVGIIGPFALGLVMRSRRRLADQLAARGAELEMERELFAAEAVRYERARIARELHDIVAHCISVMVIQAGAGQRLAIREPALAAEAFDAIGEALRQAESEIGRLVELLGHESGLRGRDGIRLVDELVARAAAAGLAVTCRFAGAAEELSERASEAAYRVVQESLTNALKHAPGAPVEVVIAASGPSVEITVRNGPTAAPASGLERTGGGRGLTGMRERVQACGGELAAGPAGDGGWQVLARLPRQPDPSELSAAV
jgi:signal transduction histidine kinase